MSVNPNNHALDGGRASSAMELEAVAALAKMFHWTEENGGYLGHLTSGGTFANLEALWVAGQLAPGKASTKPQKLICILLLPNSQRDFSTRYMGRYPRKKHRK
jgi:glutamate/tyrosine decarboxylase-like PLP-dependent enzyme